MREAFKDWLDRQSFTARTRSTQLAHANRIEKHYGDLDAAYDADRLAAIRTALAYTKDDERAGRPNPSKFAIEGDVYSNLAGYRATLAYYERFRESADRGADSPGAAAGIDMEALDRMKRAFLGKYPDFAELGFAAGHGSYWDDERGYKEIVLERARALLAAPGLDDGALGRRMLELLQQPPANFVGWRTFANIKGAGAEAADAAAAALGAMLRAPDDIAVVAAVAAEKVHPAITGGVLGNAAFGQVRTLVTTAMALARPEEAVAVKTRYLQRAARLLTGRALFKSGVMAAAEYREVLSLAEALFAIMRDQWGWAPRDLWDVQGFLWATSDAQTADAADDELEERPIVTKPSRAAPRNLILYGPPGTGKTFATATRAVELCDGAAPPGGREGVMARYNELVARKRISFVTFHQSYAYEDFVEGLRPEAGAAGEGEAASSGGFSLRPQAGVFRRIAELARDNRGRAVAAPKVDRSRNVFKMSLGRSGEEEGARVFRDALDGGYVVLGWGGEIDWSASQYDDFGAIKARWRQDHPEATGNDPNVQQLYALRAGMRVGDLVIVSDGNKKFRAVGEVVGPYEYRPGADDFNHRRPVRWLWHNDQGRPRELVYGRGFSQVSAYQLDSAQIDWPALEQLVAGGGEGVETRGEPEPYVLIIDEINRANISKVFGELITLIEPDKRLGGDNALTVTLPYSGDVFGVPSNLHIIGTMNTADRSIALLDTALRRRFEFEELLPLPGELGEASAACGVDLAAVLTGLNARIEYLFDREHQIGHAYFIGCRSLADLSRVMRMKVIPLLAEYFYENWEKVRQVLGETTDQGVFVGRARLLPPKGADAFPSEEGRWRYTVHADFAAHAYEQLKG